MGRRAKLEEGHLAVSASVSCMDLGRLEEGIRRVEEADVRFWHYDVVDGRFNDCLILGDQLYGYLREHSALPIELHLAVFDPARYLPIFARLGVDYVAVHAEAMQDAGTFFRQIRASGAQPVLAYRAETAPQADFEELASACAWVLKLTVNPGFSGQALQEAALAHIRAMRSRLDAAGIRIPIQADGSVNAAHIARMREAGATLFTGGTSGLFCKGRSVRENLQRLLAAAAS